MRAFGSSLPLASFRRVLCGSAALLMLGAPATIAQNASSGDDGSRRRNASAQDIQARMLTNLRERLGVVNDDEWGVISERLLKLMELRRGAAGSMPSVRGGPPGGDPRSARGGRSSGSPEVAALQTALNDKLPDAEIKVRLARLRQTRKENETKLEQAQEEFRAVLTIRQEAMAVVMGLLP